MIGDGEERVISLGFREFSNKVQCYRLKWQRFWLWVDRLEWGMYWMCVDFVSLTFCTPLDVFLDLLLHVWPPIVL